MTHRLHIVRYGDGDIDRLAEPIDPTDNESGPLIYDGVAWKTVAAVYQTGTGLEIRGPANETRLVPWNWIHQIDSYEIDELIHAEQETT